MYIPAAPIAARFHLLGQHPRIADITVKTGRKDQKHHAHFMAFPTKPLARHPMTEFMKDFGATQNKEQPNPIFAGKELLKAW